MRVLLSIASGLVLAGIVGLSWKYNYYLTEVALTAAAIFVFTLSFIDSYFTLVHRAANAVLYNYVKKGAYPE